MTEQAAVTEVEQPVVDLTSILGAVKESEDLTVNKSFERELPRAGVCFLRLRDYIEVGRHQGKNKTHKPALVAMLTFELAHQDHLIEIDDKKVPSTITITINKGTTSKSGYRKLFATMNAAYDNKYTHFAEMLNLPFLGEVYHKQKDKDSPIYANLDLEGAWSMKKPVQVDAVSAAQTPINIPELSKPCKIFLWENATVPEEQVVAMWNSIFIEGEREIQDDKVEGGVRTESKNWIQEKIMRNLEWEGSTTQALTQETLDLDGLDMGDNVVEAKEPVRSTAIENPEVAQAAEMAPEAIPEL